MYIDGQWTHAKSDAVFDVFNPATQDKISEVPDGGHEGISEYLETKLGGFSV
jgi:acyl-CoA reductase-like NAD-dependent aldehyde dehydrogenase